jgi:four helix bundle protein
MRDFQKLTIWQKGHSITLKIYNCTKEFPSSELYGLTSQMRRSSSSIPTNIAEGCGRNSTTELNRFLTIAAGSTSELQYQLILAKDLGYLNENLLKELYNETVEIRKMIFAFAQKL